MNRSDRLFTPLNKGGKKQAPHLLVLRETKPYLKNNSKKSFKLSSGKRAELVPQDWSHTVDDNPDSKGVLTMSGMFISTDHPVCLSLFV